MNNIFKIYKKDIKDIFTNWALLVIVIGLAILPSLYAWFNIKASWDPYGSTSNISVAVVNNDDGANIIGKNINIGNQVIDKLKKNKNLGWKFVDNKTALEGLKKGTYYATIEIPKNFSQDLTSLVSSNVKKGEIIYTVNEKLNAVAPKITDKGASTIQLEVNQTVDETVGEVIFDIFNKIGIELQEQLPKLTNLENNLVDVQSKFKDIDETVNLASDATDKISNIIKELQNDMPLIKDTINNSKNLSQDIKTFLQDTKGSVSNIAPIIKDDLNIISEISSSASNVTNNLIDAINKGSDDAPKLIQSLQDKLSNLYSTSSSLENFLVKLNKINPNSQINDSISKLNNINTKLNSAIASLDNLKNQVSNGEKPVSNTLNKILTVSNDINNISSNILNNFDSKIVQPIDNIFKGGLDTANNIITVLDNAETKLPQVEDVLSTSLAFSHKANEGVDFIKEKLPWAKSTIDDLTSAIKKLNDSDNMKDLIDLLKSDVVSRAEFLKQPVDLVTEKIYPIKYYGYAMTPFYTVLSLWVGVLLLLSLLSTEVSGDYKSYEVYLGRGLTILSITLVQSLIVSLGDLYILKVVTKEPLLFVLLSLFISATFTAIVYSLVSLLGNLGKALAVVLLVIQLGGSGGTFPIQVTPVFFQKVNPFLPFTYAISGLREAVGGIYLPNLQKDIIMLIIFMIVPIIIGALFKNNINKATAGLTNKLSESGLTEH